MLCDHFIATDKQRMWGKQLPSFSYHTIQMCIYKCAIKMAFSHIINNNI